MRKQKLLVVTLTCLLAAFVTVATASVTPLITPYPHASLQEQDAIAEKDYRVAIGSVDVVNNAVRVSKELRLDVTGNNFLYRVAEGYSSKHAIEYIVEELNKSGAKVLFNCSGRSCGDSNSWANIMFRNASLYGREGDQNYVIARLNRLERKPLVLAYTAKRGNGNVYLYIEELYDAQNDLAAEPATGSGVASRLALLSETTFTDKGDLVSKMNANYIADIKSNYTSAEGKIWLVLHYVDDSIAVADLIRHSNEMLTLAKEVMVKEGIPKDHVDGVGVGPFLFSEKSNTEPAPNGKSPTGKRSTGKLQVYLEKK